LSAKATLMGPAEPESTPGSGGAIDNSYPFG
jgi:hypothetical protein